MANTLDANGLSIESLTTIINNLTTGMQAIYGADIAIDSNSPDGQMINLIAQVKRDLLEVTQSVYNNFDPDNAIGINQDTLYAINGLIRKPATFSLQDVTITVDRSLTLQGLDANAQDPNGTGYTVSDSVGNQFILLDTQNPASAGSYTYTFRAKNLGEVTSSPNTITNPVSIVLGVTLINNTTGASSIGQTGETDAQFKARRVISTANSSKGFIDGLYGDLLNISGVIGVAVYENKTNVTDANGVPAHSIWPIVDGGSDADIGAVIYADLNLGCGMRGATTYDITTSQGQIFTAQFDRPSSQNLYIRFDIQPTKSGQTFDTAAIKTYLIDNLIYNIYQYADTSTITVQAIGAINSLGLLGVPVNVEISLDGSTYTDYLLPSAVNNKFTLNSSNISITIL